MSSPTREPKTASEPVAISSANGSAKDIKLDKLPAHAEEKKETVEESEGYQSDEEEEGGESDEEDEEADDDEEEDDDDEEDSDEEDDSDEEEEAGPGLSYLLEDHDDDEDDDEEFQICKKGAKDAAPKTAGDKHPREPEKDEGVTSSKKAKADDA